jgi:hypothetical protein
MSALLPIATQKRTSDAGSARPWSGVRCQISFVAANEAAFNGGGAPEIPDLLLKD